jgi:hypothetical protein
VHLRFARDHDEVTERQREERLTRLLLRLITDPIPLWVALLIWLLGIDVHPHRIGSDCIAAGIGVVVDLAGAWLVYRARMKTARKLWQAGAGAARDRAHASGREPRHLTPATAWGLESHRSWAAVYRRVAAQDCVRL